MVSKSCVHDFLLTNNSWYQTAGVRYSQENMDDLFDHSAHSDGESIPCAVELCHLPTKTGNPLEIGTSGYTDRYIQDDEPGKNIVMDSVAYTDRDDNPQSYHHMKATALALMHL